MGETVKSVIDACIRSDRVCPVAQIYFKDILDDRIVVLEGTCYSHYAFANKYIGIELLKSLNLAKGRPWKNKQLVTQIIDNIIKCFSIVFQLRF